ncbi:MAG: hypothetical protein GF409_03200 [Candidatus Omnitrophica bacterium]|nr:hypothetical protein [Candidatus Omnitrophota bacterium]
MKKRYLQACELGGSIYGRKGSAEKKRSTGRRSGKKEDMMSSYNKFYKSQVAAMYKVLHRDR